MSHWKSEVTNLGFIAFLVRFSGGHVLTWGFGIAYATFLVYGKISASEREACPKKTLALHRML